MIGHLDCPVLVLNRFWQPVHTCSVRRSLHLLCIGHAQVVPIERGACGLDPREICRVLARRGLHRLLVEGGGITVSRFLDAGALHRLQVTVAPVILGSGRPAITLPEISDLEQSLRPRTRRVVLGDDVMIECDFEAVDAVQAGDG
jgi:riboflavin biosynthesis pyrimidine reductase